MDFNTAMTNRSLRTVRAELEFLVDAGVLNATQLRAMLDQLPSDGDSTSTRNTNNNLNNAVSNMRLNTNNNSNSHQSPVPAAVQPTYNEKQDYAAPAYAATPASMPLPPPEAPAATALTHAVALYAYAGTDPGDLSLQPNDRVSVTEYMNAEWWKGRSERTGQEGIFPRSYVRIEEKVSGYGNMPLDVANGAGSQPGAVAAAGEPNKYQDGGKKIGKKLGNAAIFGAGATLGGNLVNSIF